MKKLVIFFLVVLASCNEIQDQTHSVLTKEEVFFVGADLSYVNEMEDCNGFYTYQGKSVDPFFLFAEKGANLVRLRYWNNPDWTSYSSYTDVEKSIRRTKEHNMKVLLDFHYSDTWADPGDQHIPASWAHIESLDLLIDSVYAFTHAVVNRLFQKDLTPDMVQIGNETNGNILLKDHEENYPLKWERNIALFESGIRAISDFNKQNNTEIKTMIHIAQPENALSWFKEAIFRGFKSYDWVGISYYPKWSEYKVSQISSAIDSLSKLTGKPVMIVETAYPHSLINSDEANNIMGKDALIEGYPPTPQGQLKYLVDLTKQMIKGGGKGVIYWEPAWVVNDCSTLWGKGSHWDNATFFDATNENEALEAFDFFSYPYEFSH